MHLLSVSDLSKTFRQRTVLTGISFDLAGGTLNAIVGENGAGKSTLLKILTGELKADKGSVATHGVVGYCPQQPQLFPLLTVRENLHYFATAYNLLARSENKRHWLGHRDFLLNNLG